MAAEKKYVEIVKQAISKLFVVPAESLSEKTDVYADLNAKSVVMMQVMCEVEDVLDIDLNMMDFRRRKTIEELAEYVQEEDEG